MIKQPTIIFNQHNTDKEIFRIHNSLWVPRMHEMLSFEIPGETRRLFMVISVRTVCVAGMPYFPFVIISLEEFPNE